MRQKWSRRFFVGHSRDVKNTNNTKRIDHHKSGIKKRVPSRFGGAETYSSSAFLGRNLGHHHNQVAAATKKKLTSSLFVSSSSQAVSLFFEKKESTKGYVCILGVSLKAFKNVLAIFFCHSCLGFWEGSHLGFPFLDHLFCAVESDCVLDGVQTRTLLLSSSKSSS